MNESPKSEEVLDIASSLLHRERYSEESKKYEGPFSTYEKVSGDKVLYYFGANHSREIGNPQYAALKECWLKFLNATEGKERIVLVEGQIRKIFDDEVEAVKRGSEGNFISLLAHQRDVSIACPDVVVTPEQILTKIPEVTSEELYLYDFLSFLDTFYRLPESNHSPEKGFALWEKSFGTSRSWPDLKLTYEKTRDLYLKVVGRELTNEENPNRLIDPNKMESVINLISRTISDIRDENITKKIIDYWNEGKSVLVVFGRGHLIIQKPALENLLQ